MSKLRVLDVKALKAAQDALEALWRRRPVGDASEDARAAVRAYLAVAPQQITAPDLYAALQNMVALAAPHFTDAPQTLAMDIARAALAKARGDETLATGTAPDAVLGRLPEPHNPSVLPSAPKGETEI